MMDWAQILVVILTTVLAIFLILGIVLMVMLLKLTRQIRRVAGSAERSVHMFEKTLVQARGLVSLPLIIKMVTKYIKKHHAKGDVHVDKE
jgi:hypothetical protein